ncbi:MAG TPA: hypothetical protein VMH35_11560 [Streptosporangiaceae bacterium]|nr:hypothetical protein [Streptosporangiaceae bacterium]
MTFQQTQRAVETARAELARAQADTSGWAGKERRDFDAHRMKPLAAAGSKLTTALQDAQEAQARAERLM